MIDKELLAPCGLYCGVCGILMAHRDDNTKFKERLSAVYGVSADEIVCEGCMSQNRFKYCQVCPIRSCTEAKSYQGCYQCQDFPCNLIDDFPLQVGKKVIMRAIPAWRELGTEDWVGEELKRYHCPQCGYELFRGAKRCRGCGEAVDQD